MKNTILLIFITIPLLVNAQIFVHQQATGNNDGSSWQNAYTELQDAIENAPVGAEIWIAEGTYSPSSAGMSAVFVISNSLSLYGGFAGTESNLQERNPENNPAVLSGDYSGDDVTQTTDNPLTINYLNRSDNAERVIDGRNTTGTILLDGLIIEGGESSGTGPGATFSAINNTLKLVIKNCIFKNNNANTGTAGALRFSASENGTIDAQVINTSFIQNSAGSKGGAIWGTGSTSSNFLVNVEYTNCLFKQNYSIDRGGAVTHDLYYNTVYTNCIFDGNRGDDGGATFENSSFDTYYYNCTFHKNSANSSAPAIFNLGNFGNTAVYLYNCIFYEHSGQPQNILRGTYDNTFITSHNIFEANSFADMLDAIPNSQDLGGNQFAVNPMFVDAEQGDFNLTSDSPAINTGSNAAVQSGTDYTDMISRIVDDVVDLGALEYHLDLTGEFSDTNPVSCFGANDGSVEITADNYPPFTYVWSDPTIQGASPDNLPPGSHQVTITNNIGDETILSVDVSENPEINVQVVTTPDTNIGDGTAEAITSGGTPPFTYTWSNGLTTSTVSNLAVGTYELTVTDAIGCTVTSTVDIDLLEHIQSIDDTDEIQVFQDSEGINIELSSDILSQLDKLFLYNSIGQVVHQQPVSQTNIHITLSHLPSSVYILMLAGEQAQFSKRLLR